MNFTVSELANSKQKRQELYDEFMNCGTLFKVPLTEREENFRRYIASILYPYFNSLDSRKFRIARDLMNDFDFEFPVLKSKRIEIKLPYPTNR